MKKEETSLTSENRSKEELKQAVSALSLWMAEISKEKSKKPSLFSHIKSWWKGSSCFSSEFLEKIDSSLSIIRKKTHLIRELSVNGSKEEQKMVENAQKILFDLSQPLKDPSKSKFLASIKKNSGLILPLTAIYERVSEVKGVQETMFDVPLEGEELSAHEKDRFLMKVIRLAEKESLGDLSSLFSALREGSIKKSAVNGVICLKTEPLPWEQWVFLESPGSAEVSYRLIAKNRGFPPQEFLFGMDSLEGVLPDACSSSEKYPFLYQWLTEKAVLSKNLLPRGKFYRKAFSLFKLIKSVTREEREVFYYRLHRLFSKENGKLSLAHLNISIENLALEERLSMRALAFFQQIFFQELLLKADSLKLKSDLFVEWDRFLSFVEKICDGSFVSLESHKKILLLAEEAETVPKQLEG